MTKKINVAFVYKPSYKFLTGNHFDNTTYYFFMLALKRNSRINIFILCLNLNRLFFVHGFILEMGGVCILHSFLQQLIH